MTGRFTRPALLSGLFRDLFALAALPTSLLHAFQRRLGQRPLLGIHFRAGNETTWSDPARHSLGELDLALSCAAQVEMQLELVDAVSCCLRYPFECCCNFQSAVLILRSCVLVVSDKTNVGRSTLLNLL